MAGDAGKPSREPIIFDTSGRPVSAIDRPGPVTWRTWTRYDFEAG